jgi:hypothetical protein
MFGHNSGPPLVNVWHRESQGQAAHVLEGEENRNAVIPSPFTEQPMEVADEIRVIGRQPGKVDKSRMRLSVESYYAK